MESPGEPAQAQAPKMRPRALVYRHSGPRRLPAKVEAAWPPPDGDPGLCCGSLHAPLVLSALEDYSSALFSTAGVRRSKPGSLRHKRLPACPKLPTVGIRCPGLPVSLFASNPLTNMDSASRNWGLAPGMAASLVVLLSAGPLDWQAPGIQKAGTWTALPGRHPRHCCRPPAGLGLRLPTGIVSQSGADHDGSEPREQGHENGGTSTADERVATVTAERKLLQNWCAIRGVVDHSLRYL